MSRLALCFYTGGMRGEAWRWRRRLWAWEEEELLEECRLLLHDVSLQTSVSNVWQWLPDPSWGYSVRGVYDMLTSKESPQMQNDLELIQHKQVSLKVTIFAWRLLRDRLPTKSNFPNRGILSFEACLCVASCGQVEDARHLFLSCSFFGSLWPLLQSWIGFEGAHHQDISDHFTQIF